MDEFNLYINKESLKQIKQISDGSVILAQEGDVICREGDWMATDDENNYIANNNIMFLCLSTNFLYGGKTFWTDRIDSRTVIAKRLDNNERIIIKKSKIKKLDKSFFVCVHYVEGENDYDSVLSAITSAVIQIELQNYVCVSCGKSATKDECVFYLNNLYHKKCLKCSVCKKEFTEADDIVFIAKGLLVCKEHEGNLNSDVNEKVKESFVDEVFDDSTFPDDDMAGYKPEEVLIPSETVKKSVQEKPYDQFIPTMKLHFDKEINEVDYDKLREFLGDDAVILKVERGSTVLRIALLSVDLAANIEEQYNNYANELKDRINGSIENRALVGKVDDNVQINIPDNKQIEVSVNRPSSNHLQNSISLNEVEIEKIKKDVLEKLKNEKGKDDWKFLFNHEELYDQMEEQLRKDLAENPYEMIIVGQTVVANKFFGEFDNIKKKIPKEHAKEQYLYHGSRLENHIKIVRSHFLMPGEPDYKRTDGGYYGKGLYTTNNPYYASMYSNNFKPLQVDMKSYVFCGISVYNDSIVKVMTDKSYFGKQLDNDVKENYGANRALVGNTTEYWPIKEEDKCKNAIYAEEYVFPSKYQYIPFCSFTIMRKDHYILWKDDNVDNPENEQYKRYLCEHLEISLYPKKNIEDALDTIKTKKYALVKLITNGGKEDENGKTSGQVMIEKAREITKNNHICLVFAYRKDVHMKWVTKMKNVLFTNDKEDFMKFAELKMNYENICKFVGDMKSKFETWRCKFDIKYDELWDFSKEQIGNSRCNLS